MSTFKLGEICQLSKGKTITRATANEGTVPVVGGGLGPTYYHDTANIEAPVITISASGANAGFVNYWDIPIWASDCTTIIELPDRPATIGFIYKYLQSKQEFINSELRRGSAQPHVYPSDIADLVIKLPPLDQQIQLVEKLDRAFAEIAEIELGLDVCRDFIGQLTMSSLHNLLNDEETQSRIGDICTVTSSKRIFKSEYVKNGIPFYRTKELKELANNKKIRTELFISKERFSAIKEQYGIPINGDILISAVGTIGEVLVVEELGDFYFKDGNIVWLKSISDEFNPDFLAMCLRNITKALNDVAQGSAYSALTIEKLVEIKIPRIGIPEQLKIVDEFNELSKTINDLEINLIKKKDLVIELRQSLLREAFTQEEDVA